MQEFWVVTFKHLTRVRQGEHGSASVFHIGEQPVKDNRASEICTLVGLFLKLEDALRCFSSLDGEYLDPRWEESTHEVLLAGGSKNCYVLTLINNDTFRDWNKKYKKSKS